MRSGGAAASVPGLRAPVSLGDGRRTGLVVGAPAPSAGLRSRGGPALVGDSPALRGAPAGGSPGLRVGELPLPSMAHNGARRPLLCCCQRGRHSGTSPVALRSPW